MPMLVWKPLYQINTTDAGVPPDTSEQSGSSIAALTGGRFLVGWSDFTNTFSVGLGAPDSVAQRLDPLGGLAGGEVHVSSVFLDGKQQFVDVAALPGGGFVAAYQTEDQAYTPPIPGVTGENISFEVFDSSGAQIATRGNGGPPPLFGDTGVFQLGNETTPTVTAFADGSFMIVHADDLAGNNDIVAFVVDAAGVEQGPFTIDGSAAAATLPDAATLSNDTVAVAYESDANAGDILFSVRTNTGGAVASGTVAGTAAAETGPAIAALKGPGGGFVVTWVDADGDGAGNSGIKARLYSNAGVAAGVAFAVNLTVTAGAQSAPTATGLLDGGIFIAWRDEPSGEIRARRFDAAGAPVETEFVMASLDALSDPQLTTLGDGRVALSVTNTDGLRDLDVHAVIWDPRDTPFNGTAASDVLTSRPNGGAILGLGADDTIFSGLGNDGLDGGAGTDTVDYALAPATVRVSLAIVTAQNTISAGTDTLALFENLNGSDFSDVLAGNGGANTINGGGGKDRIDGGLGADKVNGGSGNDSIKGGGGDDPSLNGEAGNDSIDGGGGNDAVDGGANKDTLNGNDDNDTLNGGIGNDNLRGGSGNDRLIAGPGNDVQTGGTGLDTFVFTDDSEGNDRIDDWVAADDQIEIVASEFGGALAAGPLPANRLVVSAAPAGTIDIGQFLYNTVTGQLSWDSDGNGPAGAVAVVRLFNGGVAVNTLDVADFDIVA